jgi:hypothetical protein
MHALKAQNSPHIKSMIELARSEPLMAERDASILNKDHFQNLSFIKKITISLEHIVSFFNSLKNNKCF